MTRTLNPDDPQILALADWRVILGRLHARFETGGFEAGLAFVNEVGRIAQEVDHHPDIELTYDAVYLRLVSHDVGALTARDVRLAARIGEVAAAHGLTGTPERTTQLEVALDTPDTARIAPFWQAVMETSHRRQGRLGLELVSEQLPTLWFQESNETGPAPARRFHLDVTVPPEVARHRIDEALAQGGTLVDDAFAPAWWVLADPDGNEVCVCTAAPRN